MIGSAEMNGMQRNERGGRIQSGALAVALLLATVSLSKAQTSPQQGSVILSVAPGTGLPGRLKPGYVQGEIIVKLQASPSGGIQVLSEDAIRQRDRASLLRLREKYGVEHKGQVFKRARNAMRFHVLTTQRDVPAVCAELNADPEVERAQPNYIYRPCRTPNDPEFADQYAHQLIQMEDAWDICTGSRDVIVGVIGSGVDVNHPDLKDNIWVNKGETPGNNLDDDGNGFVDDVYGWDFMFDSGQIILLDEHETQVAGVIAGVGNNGIGVSGVNWQCSIMVLEMGYTSDEIAAALDYATANGAHVVNMSFGGENLDAEDDAVVRAAIDNAYKAGVFLVASAGNSDSTQPSYPAGYPNVMAVASTNGEDTKTGHSSFGAWVDISAPGTDIVTTDVDGEYIATAGTSFSSPYVAAVAALLFAHRPDLTAIEARAILENTTDPLDYGDLDPNLGYIGTGRVNAYEALLAVDERLPLGEISAPRQNQVFAADANQIGICALVHGDSHRIEYRLYGQTDWTAVPDGAAPDPNGFVRVSLANPGVGTYELRLRVAAGQRTHIDRKIFGVTVAANQAHWPRPEDPESDEFWGLYFVGSPLCLDINGDGRNEIIQSSVDFLSYYYGGGMVNIWTQDGNSLPNWPVSMGSYGYPTSLAVGDIDGDGDYEVVAGSEMDGAVCAYHVESGKIVDGNWPALVGGWYGYIAAGPVLADLDDDGNSEILVALDLETMDMDGLIALQGDGSYLWQRRYTSVGPMSVADMDRDGDVEIALSGLGPGLTRVYTFILDNRGQQVARWKGGSPKGTAIADLDGDGETEMVFCTEQEVMAVHADGSTVWKTRVSDPMDAEGGICIGDLDGDGLSEVYVTTFIEGDGFLFTNVYAFDHKGRLLADAGYPKMVMGDPTRTIPLIADIDGDGGKELMVGPAGEPVMAWEADGSVTPGFPLLSLTVDMEVTPAIA
ncbi:MAG: S8 family serine peptidase, partial [Sedimentisphaerales bacterium]|nr:S8 family serine peptidase [Sedimentisphaerales bacterium]